MSAGCSIPSGVPSANALARLVATAVHAGSQEPLRVFCLRTFGTEDPSLDDIAEYFLQRDDDLSGFAALIPFQDWSLPPNRAHEGIVRLALEGFYDKVMTTNWDLLIEIACASMGCSRVSVRSGNELAARKDAQWVIYKIHGCQTRSDSLIAATSQMANQDPPSLWSEAQVVAAFQNSCMTFLGYSGSVPRISENMARVAQRSDPVRVGHYAVDVASWPDFSDAAPTFVAVASIDEDHFHSSAAEAFVEELVDRLLRRKVLEINEADTKDQLKYLLALGGISPASGFSPPEAYTDSIAGGPTSEELLRILTRQFSGTRYPTVEGNRAMLGRLLAWASLLIGLGWEPVGSSSLFRCR